MRIVDGDGKQYNMDACVSSKYIILKRVTFSLISILSTVAYKQAALNCITYLMKIGYSAFPPVFLLNR